MKKLITFFVLLAVLCGFNAPAFAEEAAAPAAVSAPAAAVAVAAAPAVAPAAVAAPVPNKGDTAWLLTSTLLVIMMSIPGLALFYGGLVLSLIHI